MNLLDKPVEVGIRKVCATQEDVDFWTERFRFLNGGGTDLPEYNAMREAMVQATVRYREIMMDHEGFLRSLRIPGGVDEEDYDLALKIYDAQRLVSKKELANFLNRAIVSGDIFR